MNTLEEERYIRAQRQRKQDLYRLMLDQQVSQRHQNKYQPNSDSYLKKSSPGVHERRDKYDIDQSNYRNRYFPTINEEKRTQPLPEKAPRLSSINQSGDEDRTQIYLSNCEQIIKNLRQLKRKKKQKESTSLASGPLWTSEKDNTYNNVSVQYFPRSNHFTSQGTPYNKIVPSNSNFKPTNRDRLRTLQDSEDGTVDEKSKSINKKSHLLRKRQVPAVGTKGYSLDKYTFSNKLEDKQNGKSEHQESDTPLGLRESDRSLQSNSKVNPSKNMKSRVKFKQSEQSDSEVKDKNPKILINGQQRERQDRHKEQRQLSECLIQLTKFLKLQNKQKQSLKQQRQYGQSMKVQTGQFALQTTINPENSIESASKKTQNGDQADRKKLSPQSNTQERNFNSLKVKAIEALKQVNKKSEQFASMASRRSGRVQTKRSTSPVHEYQQNLDSNRSSLIQSKRESSSPEIPSQNQKPLASKNFKKIFSIEKQYSLLSAKGNQIQDSRMEKEDKNSELVQLLMSQLQKQGDQNKQLSYCLKELTTYLKDQNHEMEALKHSREGAASENNHITPNSAESGSDLNEIEEQEEEEEANKLEGQQKLQQTVLNSLKKARLKGSAFKEKIQNFRKQHQKMNILSQKPKKDKQPIQDKQELPREQAEVRNEAQLNDVPASGEVKEVPAENNESYNS